LPTRCVVEENGFRFNLSRADLPAIALLAPLTKINKNPLYFLASLLLYFSDSHTKTEYRRSSACNA
jgi:hypothetical protein